MASRTNRMTPGVFRPRAGPRIRASLVIDGHDEEHGAHGAPIAPVTGDAGSDLLDATSSPVSMGIA